MPAVGRKPAAARRTGDPPLDPPAAADIGHRPAIRSTEVADCGCRGRNARGQAGQKTLQQPAYVIAAHGIGWPASRAITRPGTG